MRTERTRPVPPTPRAADVLAGLQRILASGDFDASPRSRAFLRFIVEETLAGRQEGLTQDAIATRVFDRRKDFDPTVDPIVRIQAGRLRRSIERVLPPRWSRRPGADRAAPRRPTSRVLRWAGAGRCRRRPATDAARPVEDRGGWPSIVLGVRAGREGDVRRDPAAGRFLEYLAVELDRYRDVRVVLRHDLNRLPPVPGQGDELRAHRASSWRRTATRGCPCDLVDSRTARQVWAEEYREDPEHAADFPGRRRGSWPPGSPRSRESWPRPSGGRTAA